MKKPIKKLSIHICNVIITFFGLGAMAASAAERDPFKPFIWSAPAIAGDAKPALKDGEITNPLTDKPLSSYTVIGVVVSPTDAIAVLKSRDKREYFAYIGDMVGMEGGKLETINSEGVTINVSNKIVTMKVSNRFDTPDEKQTGEKNEKK